LRKSCAGPGGRHVTGRSAGRGLQGPGRRVPSSPRHHHHRSHTTTPPHVSPASIARVQMRAAVNIAPALVHPRGRDLQAWLARSLSLSRSHSPLDSHLEVLGSFGRGSSREACGPVLDSLVSAGCIKWAQPYRQCLHIYIRLWPSANEDLAVDDEAECLGARSMQHGGWAGPQSRHR